MPEAPTSALGLGRGVPVRLSAGLSASPEKENLSTRIHRLVVLEADRAAQLHIDLPLDTNGVERALRGVAVGRKNHYGSRSERGTRVAALFYSLIESAKLAGVEPRGYLREATLRAVRNPGTATLPRDLKSSES